MHSLHWGPCVYYTQPFPLCYAFSWPICVCTASGNRLLLLGWPHLTTWDFVRKRSLTLGLPLPTELETCGWCVQRGQDSFPVCPPGKKEHQCRRGTEPTLAELLALTCVPSTPLPWSTLHCVCSVLFFCFLYCYILTWVVTSWYQEDVLAPEWIRWWLPSIDDNIYVMGMLPACLSHNWWAAVGLLGVWCSYYALCTLEPSLVCTYLSAE